MQSNNEFKGPQCFFFFHLINKESYIIKFTGILGCIVDQVCLI